MYTPSDVRFNTAVIGYSKFNSMSFYIQEVSIYTNLKFTQNHYTSEC